MTDYLQTGLVTEEQKNYYVVDCTHGTFQATLTGALRHRKKRICTGDNVDIHIINNDTREAVVRRVHKRKNFLPRPPIANIDQVILVVTVVQPQADLITFDRFLFAAEYYGFSPRIVCNKVDLVNSGDQELLKQIHRTYCGVGYDVLDTSASTGYQLDLLVEKCTNRRSIFAGVSGVGKSSLLSRILPDQDFRTSELSTIGRGVHTTTSTTLLHLPTGGYIADTPGFAFIDLPVVLPQEVAHYFPEISNAGKDCRFSNCIHQNEPSCRVKQLVSEGSIAHSRYENYLLFYSYMQDQLRVYPKGLRKSRK
ncbi:MAG: ribosome small subunit-dependent GTPase A [Chitinispirillaceae bacterium]